MPQTLKAIKAGAAGRPALRDLRGVEIYGSGFNSKQDLPAGGQINFNLQAPAHFLIHRTYAYRGTCQFIITIGE